jgi:Ca2+-binding RTX toxin-like protein
MSGTGITYALAGAITDAKFSPDGSTMYVASGRFIRVVDVATGSVVQTYDLGEALGAFDLSVDGDTLVVAGKNERVISGEAKVTFYTIDLTTDTVGQTQLTLFEDIPQLVHDVAFLASGKVLVSFQSPSSLHLFDPATGALENTDISPYGSSANLIDSADGTTVYIIGSSAQQATFVYTDGVGITASEIRIADPYAGASLPPPLTGASAISSDGSLILSADRSAMIDASLAQVKSIEAGTVAGADIDEANNLLYSSLGGGAVAQIDLATGELLGIFEIGKDIAAQSSQFSSSRMTYGDLVQVSADGSTLAVVTVDGIALVDLTVAVPVSTPGDDVLTQGTRLYGLAGNDILGGDEAGQAMFGGRGNDTYLLYQIGDAAHEMAGEGHDKVFTNQQNYYLDENVEDLEFVGTEGAWLVGNELDNTVTGGSGDDYLTGSFGDDVLNGGAGFDVAVYGYVDSGSVIDLALTGPQNTGTFGFDTLVSIEGLQGSALGDTLSGNGAGNLLDGRGGDDVLVGRGGYDTLIGGEGNDWLDGGPGLDILDGGEGHDLLDGGTGADTMTGGAGDDSYFVDHANDKVVELDNGGIDMITSNLNVLALTDFVEILVLAGTATEGTGNALDNLIDAGTAGVTLNGLGGHDTLLGNHLANRLDGGTGNDLLIGAAGEDILIGGMGHDALDGGAGSDTLDGGAGDDIYLLDASDVLIERRDSGIDAVVVTFENYTLGGNVEALFLADGIVAGGGNILDNLVVGNQLANVLDGRGGNDDILAGAGDDIAGGQGGNDAIWGEGGNDMLSGGMGDDFLCGGAGADFLKGDAGNDRIYGNAENDTVNGDLGDDNVFGGIGDDRVFGGSGADIVNGQGGDDLIVGGPGIDLLVGGLGADRFLFNEGHLGGSLAVADRITDFSQVQGDTIDFRMMDADTGSAGDQAFTWIGNAAFSGTAGELRTEIVGNTTYVYGDRDGNGTADFALWLTRQIGLTEGDFVL